MCGIVGAVASRDIVPVLIEGLRRLEYRGYDSCGVAVLRDGQLKRARSVSRVAELEPQAAELPAFTGIAHTRWATHGAPTTDNAHPHFSSGPGEGRFDDHALFGRGDLDASWRRGFRDLRESLFGIATIGHQHHVIGSHGDDAGAARETGEIADVGRCRDEHCVELLLGHHPTECIDPCSHRHRRERCDPFFERRRR